jgi:hypothetical protein
MAKKTKRPPPQAGIAMTPNKRDGKKQLMQDHRVTLKTLEVMALCDAANYAANRGFNDGGNWLRSAFNALLDTCGMECEYGPTGKMTLILPLPKKGSK